MWHLRKLVEVGARRVNAEEKAGFQLRMEAREQVSKVEPDIIMLLVRAGGWGSGELVRNWGSHQAA